MLKTQQWGEKQINVSILKEFTFYWGETEGKQIRFPDGDKYNEETKLGKCDREWPWHSVEWNPLQGARLAPLGCEPSEPLWGS